MADIHQLPNASLAELDALYRDYDTSGLDSNPGVCATVARRALSLGEPLLAYDLCMIGLRGNSSNPILRQLQGLALARSGAQEQARELLESLCAEGHRDEETLGILARIYKDRYYEQNSPEGEESLRRSQELYYEAYRLTGGYWTGINAATLAYALGDKEIAIILATKVKNQCLLAEEKSSGPDLWRCATLGEAALLLGNQDKARRWYTKALEAGAGHGDRASMRRNARLIMGAANRDILWLDQVLPSPIVAVFSGHMTDIANRSTPRFPERMVSAVAKALSNRLESANVQIGYGSAASGADILFHELMLDLGRETHVVLPEPPDSFVTASVVRDSQSNWVQRFQNVLNRAASVAIVSNSMSGDIGYAYNNWMVLGLARLRARQLEGNVCAFALWDGNSDRLGGTSRAVQDWQKFDQEVEWLSPLTMPKAEWITISGQSGSEDIARSIGSQRIISMLFADAVGFSRLPDDSIPAFVKYFLGTVAQVLNKQDEPPLVRYTWGDGLYCCFATPRAAGLFALELCDVVRTTDWTAFGLPATLSLRVALHCGPAHEVIDPVTQQRNFTGAHVSRAARLEPVTPPGSVYSSQSFAALCKCENVSDFACEYVGRMPLAKKYGECPTYCVRSRERRL